MCASLRPTHYENSVREQEYKGKFFFVGLCGS